MLDMLEILQGKFIDLWGDISSPRGIQKPYIDFHYPGKVEEYNTRIINDKDGRLSVLANTLSVSGSLNSRCIELEGQEANPAPYINFHYQGPGLGVLLDKKDYNTRIINNWDGQLTIDARTLSVSGDCIELGGHEDISKPHIDFHYQHISPRYKEGEDPTKKYIEVPPKEWRGR